MLTQRFREYLKKAFYAVPSSKEADDLRAEFMDALTSRAMDMKGTGLSDDEIYEACISGLGDISGAIKSIKSNPLTVLRDNRFWLKLLYSGVFMLAAVIIYLAVSFATGKWGLAAVIIFPSASGLLYVAATAQILANNIRLKRHYTSGLIIASYTVILVLAAYFVISFGFHFDLAKTWSVFPLIPVLCIGASIFTFKVLRKKNTPLVLYLFFISALSTAAYLISAAVTGLYHPLWIIILVGAAINIAILIYRINLKIDKNERKN